MDPIRKYTDGVFDEIETNNSINALLGVHELTGDEGQHVSLTDPSVLAHTGQTGLGVLEVGI